MNEKLINWSKEFNHLPWRQNRTLYKTLVSEIMLQQTNVSTVLNHFEKFLLEYPAIEDIAKATDEQLTISWKGLGYYRRARNLKKACEWIVNKYEGKIPLDFHQLLEIPGIGEYTANAILGIGNNESKLALDANLERVIARLYEIKVEKGLKLQKEIKLQFEKKIICQEIEAYGGRKYNEALMDLGRNYCQARKASCILCPLNKLCLSYKNNSVSEIPNISIMKKESYELVLLRIILEKNGKYLVYKKNEKEWLSGQYEVPTFLLSSEDISLIQYSSIDGDFDYLPEFKTAITKYKITNKVLWVNEEELKAMGLDINDYFFESINLSTASTKAINL